MSSAVSQTLRVNRAKGSSWADALRSVAGSDRSLSSLGYSYLAPPVSSVRVRKSDETWAEVSHRIGYLCEHDQSDAALSLCRDALGAFRASYGAAHIKSLPLLRQVAIRESPDYAIQIKNYSAACSLAAQIHQLQGNRQGAISMWRECLEITERPQFPNALGAANVRIELALALVSSALKEERDEARTVFKNGLRQFQRQIDSNATSGSNRPDQEMGPDQEMVPSREMLAQRLLVSALRSAVPACRFLHDQTNELRCAKGALRAAERLFGLPSLEAAEARSELAEVLSSREQYQDALDLLLVNTDLVPEASTCSDAKILLWYARISEMYLNLDNREDARAIARQTLRRLKGAPESDAALACSAMAHQVAGVCELQANRPGKACEHFDSALELYQRGSRVDLYSLVETFDYSSKAMVLLAKSDTTPGSPGVARRAALYEEAENRHFSAMRVLAQTSFGHQELDVIAHQNYFEFLASIDRAEEQALQAVKIVKLCALAFGEESSGHIDALMQAAQVLEAQEQFGRAETFAQQAIDVSVRMTADSTQIPLLLFRELSHILRAGGAHAAAVEKLAEALALAEERSGRDSLQVAQTKVELSYAHIANSAYGEAQVLLDEALPSLEEVGTHLPLDVLARAYHYRGLSEIRGGGAVTEDQFNEGIRFFGQAEEQFARLQDTESVGYADLKGDLGRTLAALAEITVDSDARAAATEALRACDRVYQSKNLDKSRSHFELLLHLLELLEDTGADDIETYRTRVESLRLLFEDSGESDE